MARTFSQVGVVGLGTMGAGIAEVLARAGLDVVGVETDDDAAERGRAYLQHSTDRAVKREKLTADGQTELLARITIGTELAAVKECELVIEAIPERLEVKKALFAQLDGLTDRPRSWSPTPAR